MALSFNLDCIGAKLSLQPIISSYYVKIIELLYKEKKAIESQ